MIAAVSSATVIHTMIQNLAVLSIVVIFMVCIFTNIVSGSRNRFTTVGDINSALP